MIIMAIDPGKSGAIAVHYGGDRVIECFNMPDGVNDLERFVGMMPNPVKAYLEAQHAFPGNGAQAMFTFGRGYGQIEGVLAANKIEIVGVTPQKWQKEFQLGRVKDHASKHAWKHHLRLAACRLYPEHVVTLQQADAMLILKYAMKQEGVQ